MKTFRYVRISDNDKSGREFEIDRVTPQTFIFSVREHTSVTYSYRLPLYAINNVNCQKWISDNLNVVMTFNGLLSKLKSFPTE